MIAYADGAWIDAALAAVPLEDLGLQRGHAVFETFRLYERALFRVDEHLRRLAAGARALDIALPPATGLAAIVREVAARNDVRHATIRLLATAGRPRATAPSLFASVEPLPADWRQVADRGWTLITARIRHASPDAAPPHVKTPGRIAGLLARLEARAEAVDDALLLDLRGRVAEGPAWNIFWRSGTGLRTPGGDVGVLEGVTRAAVMRLAREHGVEVEEGAWVPQELAAADEAFATMSSLGIVPIRALDGRAFPESGALAVGLAAWYWQLVEMESEPVGRGASA